MYVVITGASRGIGRELSKVFGSHKYDLILTCEKNIDKLIELKNELVEKYNIDVKIVKGNIYDERWVPDNIIDDEIKNNTYIVINNQGKAHYGLIQDVDEKTFDDLIDSNFKNAFFTTKYFLPYMIKKKEGKIVNITSIWGDEGASNEVLYSATKGAIDTFTKALAKEEGESGISVISYRLGIISTDMCKDIGISDNVKENPVIIANMIYNSIISNNYSSGEIISISSENLQK